MKSSEELDALLKDARSYADAITTLRQATKSATVTLNTQMAALLGGSKRKLISVVSVVIEAIVNKLFVKAIHSRNDTVIQDWLKSNTDESWDRLERKLFRAVSRDGEAYILIAWDNTTSRPKLTLREAFDGTNGALVYDDPMTGAPLFGINAWTDTDTMYLDLYYPDRVEKYYHKDDLWHERRDPGDDGNPIRLTDNNNAPLGLPLIKFGSGVSDIANALQIQRDINENLIDMLAVSRNQGWPQRYLSGEHSPDYLTNINGTPLLGPTGIPIRREMRPQPGSLMLLKSENARLGQLDASVIDTSLLDKHLELLTLVTTVPHHYFRGDFPSGIALIQAETRLNAKVEDKQGELTSPLIAMLRYMLRVSNVYAGTRYDITQPIEIEWYAPQTESEDLILERRKALIDEVNTLYLNGLVSLETALRKLNPEMQDADIQAELARISVNGRINDTARNTDTARINAKEATISA